MSIHIIVAMTKNRIIGNDGKLIWHIKEDMLLFKELTINNTVIMGRNTWDSIPEKFRPLPNRKNIIISRTLSDAKGATITRNINDAIKVSKNNNDQIFCIGGAQIYKEFLELADYLHISWVKKNYQGNIIFPKINFEKWEEIHTKEFDKFIYKKYKRKK